MNLSMSLSLPFQKKSLVIKVYVSLIPTFPSKLCELTKMVKAEDLGTTKASKDLSVFCFILNNVQSFMVNL